MNTWKTRSPIVLMQFFHAREMYGYSSMHAKGLVRFDQK